MLYQRYFLHQSKPVNLVYLKFLDVSTLITIECSTRKFYVSILLTALTIFGRYIM